MFSEVNDFPILSPWNPLSKSPKPPIFTTILKQQIADRFPACRKPGEARGRSLLRIACPFVGHHMDLRSEEWGTEGQMGANKRTRTERSENSTCQLRWHWTASLSSETLGRSPYKGGSGRNPSPASSACRYEWACRTIGKGVGRGGVSPPHTSCVRSRGRRVWGDRLVCRRTLDWRAENTTCT